MINAWQLSLIYHNRFYSSVVSKNVKQRPISFAMFRCKMSSIMNGTSFPEATKYNINTKNVRVKPEILRIKNSAFGVLKDVYWICTCRDINVFKI